MFTKLPPEDVMRIVREAGGEDVARWMAKLARPGIALRRSSPRGGRGVKVGGSKLGGAPDLPAGAAWPAQGDQPLAFLAQLDLAEASGHDRAGLLPRAGLLSFFYDCVEQPWGFDPAHRGSWSVLLTPPEAALVRADVPKGALPEEDGVEGGALAELDVRFEPIVTYPDPETCDAEVSEEVFEALSEAPEADEPLHRLLGHPHVIQSPMEEECQFASNGIYVGDGEIRKKDRARAATLEEGAADWILLLQLDTDDDAHWMWGDMGILYFWIRKQDLAAGDFSNVWTILQCT
jgi:uncharacterized protein YwqG